MRVLKNKQLFYPCFGSQVEVQMFVATYPNGRAAIQLVSEMEDFPGHWEPFMTATVNLPDDPCRENEAYIKEWSENEGVTDWLVEQGVIEEHPVAGAATGYVVAYRHRFTKEFFQELLAALSAGKNIKQQGSASIGISLGLLAVALASVLLSISLRLGEHNEHMSKIASELEMRNKWHALAACHTDSECEQACVALGTMKAQVDGLFAYCFGPLRARQWADGKGFIYKQTGVLLSEATCCPARWAQGNQAANEERYHDPR